MSIKARIQMRRDKSHFLNQQQTHPEGHLWPLGPNWLITSDLYADAGEASGHYFHQDLLVAQDIFRSQPRHHLDVGSSIGGFCAHVATFREIEVIDIRPLTSTTPNISYRQVDLMAPPQKNQKGLLASPVTDSLSCLHALEHFGLGRYGDPITFDGWQIGLRNMIDLLEPGGRLYLSVPVGRMQRVEFNAHRVFSIPTIRDEIRKYCVICALHVVDDAGNLTRDLDPDSAEATYSFGLTYGCAIFFARKAVAQAA